MIGRTELRLVVAVQGMTRGLQRVKLEALIHALRGIYPRLQLIDAEPSGWSRLAGMIATFSPSRRKWRQNYYADPRTFELRTKLFCNTLRSLGEAPDAILQIGVLFDASLCQRKTPVVIYTDYVVTMTAKAGKAYRMALPEQKIQVRIEQERAAFQRAAFVLTRSKAVANEVANEYRVGREKVLAAGGGSNVTRGVAFAAARPLAAGGRFLFVGRDFHRKGGDIVLTAFYQVRKAYPFATLTMLTNAPNAITEDGVTSMSEISTDTLLSAYRNSDVLVLASRFETWGDVLIEAMAAGLACVCPHAPPLDEIVLDGETGTLVGDQSPEAFASAMKAFAANPRKSREMGEAGMARVNACFTWDITAEKIASRIDAAVAAGDIAADPNPPGKADTLKDSLQAGTRARD